MSKPYRIPVLKQISERLTAQRQKFIGENQREVLWLYRHVLKNVPRSLNRKIMKQAKISVFQFGESLPNRFKLFVQSGNKMDVS